MVAATASIDVFGSFAALLWACLVIAAYLTKALTRGTARYDRVERQGSSRIIGRAPMMAYYWSLQGAARALARAGVSPNQLSWSSLASGGAAGLAFGFGLFGIGGALYLLSAMFDNLDGLVARETGRTSEAGEVLDVSIDRYVDYLAFGGLIVYYRWSPGLTVLVVAALAASSMVTYSSAKAEALGVEIRSALMRRHDRAFLLIAGATISGFSVRFWEGRSAATPSVGVPMVVVLALLAVLGNIAAVRRLIAVAAAVRDRAAATPRGKRQSGGDAAGEMESPGVGLVVGHGAAEVEGTGQALGLDG